MCIYEPRCRFIILDYIALGFLYFPRYFRRLLIFSLSKIKNSRMFLIGKRSTFFNIFSIIFSIIKLKINIKSQKIRSTFRFKNFFNTIDTLLLLIILGYFKRSNESKGRTMSINHKEIFSHVVYQMNYSVPIWGVGLGCEQENLSQGRSYFNISIDISDCFFSRSSEYSGDGGVIYMKDGSYSLRINYSIFYECTCSSDGGAIFFISSNSAIRMTCANRCCASSYGHFAYLYDLEANQIEFLSVSYCSHTTSGHHLIYLQSGIQRADFTNSSINNAYMFSGICISSPFSYTSTYCTFSNNNVSNSRCIHLYSNSGTMVMSSANIVHNNSPSDYGVICIDGGGTMDMLYCIFQNNQNYLFYVNSGYLEVSHSFIDHSSSSFSSSTSVSTSTNNSFIKMQTYGIGYSGSHICKFPSQSQNSSLIWIVYSVFLGIFVTLLVYLYLYRGIATSLLARHQLEDSLQNDFG